jgi:hypothetical protein
MITSMLTDLGSPDYPLHPLHGIHEPTAGSPHRPPGSVRRTTSMDMVRRDGLDPLLLTGAARDIRTESDGRTTELARATLTATVRMTTRTIGSIDTDPAFDGLTELVGAPALGGFRAAVDAAAPTLRRDRAPVYTLLDDVPVTTLISGHALGASGAVGAMQSGYRPPADGCAGFVSGGLLLSSFAEGDPVIATGPVAPDLLGTDPDAWHPMATLPPHAMRRRRRVDVRRTDDLVAVDAMFRDTYVRGDGVETIVHEYTLTATVDPRDGRIVEAAATPRVLPWQECPGAVASAARIAGMTLSELHSRVRRELTGTSTCTHLNDLLRSVGDVTALLRMVPAGAM